MEIRVIGNEIEFNGYLVAHITNGWPTLQADFIRALHNYEEDMRTLKDELKDTIANLNHAEDEISALKDKLNTIKD